MLKMINFDRTYRLKKINKIKISDLEAPFPAKFI